MKIIKKSSMFIALFLMSMTALMAYRELSAYRRAIEIKESKNIGAYIAKIYATHTMQLINLHFSRYELEALMERFYRYKEEEVFVVLSMYGEYTNRKFAYFLLEELAFKIYPDDNKWKIYHYLHKGFTGLNEKEQVNLKELMNTYLADDEKKASLCKENEYRFFLRRYKDISGMPETKFLYKLKEIDELMEKCNAYYKYQYNNSQ